MKDTTSLTESLSGLGTKLKAAYGKAERSYRTSLGYARECGEILLEAKGLVEYGQWEPWLEQNFPGNERTAQRWMKIAKNWDELESKTDTVSLLGVREADILLAEPKPKPRLLESLDLFADITALVDQADVDRLMVLLRPGMRKGYWPIIDYHAGSGFWLFHTLTTPDGLASMKPSRLMVKLQDMGVTCENMDEAMQTIANLRDSGSWKPEAATWEDYCAEHFGEPAWVNAAIASVQSLEVAA